MSFSANGGQNWSRQTTDGRRFVVDTDSTGHYETLDEWEESTRPNLSFGANVGTTLYGLFPVKLGRLQAIRHTLRAGCGWSLRPGLGSKQSHSTSYSFTLDNRFDVKYLSSEGDSTLTEKKLDGLVDWSLSTSYNPKAEPDNRWSDISSGLTIKPGQASYLRLKVSNSIDPPDPLAQVDPLLLQPEFPGQARSGRSRRGPGSPTQRRHRPAGSAVRRDRSRQHAGSGRRGRGRRTIRWAPTRNSWPRATASSKARRTPSTTSTINRWPDSKATSRIEPKAGDSFHSMYRLLYHTVMRTRAGPNAPTATSPSGPA